MKRSVKNWFPIKEINNGTVKRKDGKYCKVIRIFPINFELKSIKEQEIILYSYKAFLNSCDFDIQILIQSRAGNLDTHIEKILKKVETEKSSKVREYMNSYIKMIKEEALKVAISRNFFIIVSSKENLKNKEEIEKDLNEKFLKIKNALEKCGNYVKELNRYEIIKELYNYMNLNRAKIQSIDGIFKNWRKDEYKYKG